MLLIILLTTTPVLIMWLMGFDKYNANEFMIISTAILVDLLVYIAYKILLPKLLKS